MEKGHIITYIVEGIVLAIATLIARRKEKKKLREQGRLFDGKDETVDGKETPLAPKFKD